MITTVAERTARVFTTTLPFSNYNDVVYDRLATQHFQALDCIKCTHPAVYHYGHFHQMIDGKAWVVVAGHCEKHLDAKYLKAARECHYGGKGCNGMMQNKKVRKVLY